MANNSVTTGWMRPVYADTQGLHIDNYREMWPYRDWVIKAFNDNLPFDQFTIEQLVTTIFCQMRRSIKRLLPAFNGATSQRTRAVPFRPRWKPCMPETGPIRPARFWMGLTVGCATCHDHKFDPIAQKEMYSMTAFFRNTTQYALDGNVPDTPPIVLVPPDADRQKWGQLQTLRKNLKATLAGAESGPNPDFESWLRSKKKSTARRQVAEPFSSSQLSDLKTPRQFLQQ